jgi:hypothetical protein
VHPNPFSSKLKPSPLASDPPGSSAAICASMRQ